ncbi:MAG: pro-sigmaK processing inhibitor BofA family protein [Candidatus Micrarchaeota archaeon]|nr:pro-sigmaK processing inhibitor BofA family protein [Candidatus Micrarchaeota archaeon]
MSWGLLLALLISFLIAAALFHILRKILPLILHGIAGIIIFWLFSHFGIINVPIDAATFLIAAFGGILGVILVLILSFLGVPL